ncbi:MAG: lipoprotein [Bacteroidetes bacterium]|nr:lipoprotein [Bacteroidota bacterium]
MKKFCFSLLICFFASSYSFSQGWEKVYQGVDTYFDYWGSNVQRMMVTSDGGCILAGQAYNSTTLRSDGVIIKTDAAGTITWSVTLADTCGMFPRAVIESDNGYLVSGSLMIPSSWGSFVSKIDYSGNIQWSRSYQGAAALSMMLPVAGGTVLMGSFAGYMGGVYVSGIDYNGNLLWNRTFEGYRLHASGIEATENNGFMVAGFEEAAIWGNGYDCHLMKFDSTGNLLWNRSYGYAEHFTPHAIKRTPEGDYILGGKMLMKVDTNGDIIWLKRPPYGYYIKDFCLTADHGFAAVASEDWGVPDEVFLYKLDSAAGIQWQIQIGQPHDDAFCIHNSPAGGYIISGVNTSHPGYGGTYLIRTDANGRTGCNPSHAPYINSPAPVFYPTQCVINSPVFPQSVYTTSTAIPVVSGPRTVSTDNPCCRAQASIIADGYSFSFCQGDSLHYSGYGAPHLLWSTGDTTANIVTMDTTVYLTVTNTCGSFMDTLFAHPGRIPSLSFTISNDTICPGDSVILALHDHSAYHSLQGGSYLRPNDSTYILKPLTTTTYTVYSGTSIYGPGCGNSQSFTVFLNPSKPRISRIADTLFSSSPVNNQWFFNGSMISGAASQKITIAAGGSYSVKVSGTGGCSAYSDDFACNRDTIAPGGAWQKLIGAGYGGYAKCVIQTDDGGFLIGSDYQVNNRQKITLVKTDRNGEVSWSKEYGGSENENIASLIKISGGYMIAGTTTSFGSGSCDIYVLRLDLTGQVVWGKAYGDWNDQKGAAIIQTADGNFIVGGITTNPQVFSVDGGGWIVDNNDLCLLKISGSGNILWNKRIDAAGGEAMVSLNEATGGNILIGATSQHKALLIRTDASGNLDWATLASNSAYQGAPMIKIRPDNSSIVCVSNYSGTAVCSIDENGLMLWSKKLDTPYAACIALTPDNSIMIAGKTNTFGNDVLTKLDMNGDFLWSNTFANLYRTYFTSIIQLDDGSSLLAGNIDTSMYYTDGQIYLVNTSTSGETNCTEANLLTLTNEPYATTVPALQFSSLGNETDAVTVAGNTLVFSAVPICTSVPYTVSVPELVQQITFNVYPNPSAGIYNIEYGNAMESCELHVYDISGRCVYSKNINAVNTFQVDLGFTSPGIYFMELLGKQGRAVRKLIKQ